MNVSQPIGRQMIEPRWLAVLHAHNYQVDRIADPAVRAAVAEALQRNAMPGRPHIMARAG